MDHSLLLTTAAPGERAPAHRADLSAIVEAARRGEAVAFDAIYVRYHRMVHGVLLARVAQADADDLLQEVFLQAWRQLPTLREPAALGAWLATIARHRAIDFLRGTLPSEPFEDRPGPHDGPETRLRAARALAAIRALPEAYREPLLLRLVEGLTGPEIAAQTGLTPGSVRVNLCRGMKLLRERLERGDAHGG